MSKVEPGSRRSPGGAVLLSGEEPGSRRSPGGAVLLRISAAGILYPTWTFGSEISRLLALVAYKGLIFLFLFALFPFCELLSYPLFPFS